MFNHFDNAVLTMHLLDTATALLNKTTGGGMKTSQSQSPADMNQSSPTHHTVPWGPCIHDPASEKKSYNKAASYQTKRKSTHDLACLLACLGFPKAYPTRRAPVCLNSLSLPLSHSLCFAWGLSCEQSLQPPLSRYPIQHFVGMGSAV